MAAIKVGDIVQRTYGNYSGMKKGDTDIVVAVSVHAITLNKFGKGHSHKSLTTQVSNMENE